MPVVTALIIAVVFAGVGYQGNAPRYYFLALASLVIGAGAALAGLKGLQGLVVYYGGMGLIQVFSGGFIFRNFLASNRPGGEDDL